jgi:DNA invertase Pin-like site-specific DNA recombinase
VVFKRDRLARNVFLAEQINRAVTRQGGRIEAVSGDIEGDGPEHVMVRQVLASIAEYERKMIGIRTSYAMKQHQRNGRRMGRYAPYGYELAPENPNQLVPVPSEQEAIELIREMADGGVRMIDIARRLNEEMPDACRGQVWRSKTIKKIVDRIG